MNSAFRYVLDAFRLGESPEFATAFKNTYKSPIVPIAKRSLADLLLGRVLEHQEIEEPYEHRQGDRQGRGARVEVDPAVDAPEFARRRASVPTAA